MRLLVLVWGPPLRTTALVDAVVSAQSPSSGHSPRGYPSPGIALNLRALKLALLPVSSPLPVSIEVPQFGTTPQHQLSSASGLPLGLAQVPAVTASQFSSFLAQSYLLHSLTGVAPQTTPLLNTLHSNFCPRIDFPECLTLES